METKEELVENIKEWLKMDNEIRKMKTEIKQRDIKKKQITTNLVQVMKKNEIECFDINGGSLVYKKSTHKKPINGKMLMVTLQDYYKNMPEKAEELSKFILDHREEQIKETLHRKIVKS
jgi:hypothetical protein